MAFECARRAAVHTRDLFAIIGVTIEMSLAKDLSLTVVITGKSDAVCKARKMVIQHLQTQVTIAAGTV